VLPKAIASTWCSRRWNQKPIEFAPEDITDSDLPSFRQTHTHLDFSNRPAGRFKVARKHTGVSYRKTHNGAFIFDRSIKKPVDTRLFVERRLGSNLVNVLRGDQDIHLPEKLL